MKPETEIRHLKRQLAETRCDLELRQKELLIVGKLLLEREKELTEWKMRFDTLLSKITPETL